MNILLGADPELFVSKGGKLVSAHGLVEGTKYEPFPVKHGAVQVDGMALEFNIDPADSEETFVLHLNEVMKQLQEMVPDFKLLPQPTAHFGKKYIEAQPKEAKELGCDPDYDAYTGEANIKPDGDMGFRTGGGHIHIGWTEGAEPFDPVHFQDCRKVVMALDVVLATASVLFDNDVERRKLYGKRGAFRPKPYGVEYRVLSNAWLKDEKLMRYVYRLTRKTLEMLLEGYDFCYFQGRSNLAYLYSETEKAKYILNEIGMEVWDV